MKLTSEATGMSLRPALHNRERAPHTDAPDIEMAVDYVPRRPGLPGARLEAPHPSILRCGIAASAACGASVVALMAFDARMALLKMLLAQGMSSHCGAAAAYLASARWWQFGADRSMLYLASGAAGATLAGVSVNLMHDTTGQARMLTLKTAAASSLAAFACFMLPTQIKAYPGGGGAFSVFCWGSIVATCVMSQAVENFAVAASSQKELGNAPFVPASENALSMYCTAAAGMALWSALLGYIGIHADRKAACTAGAVIGALAFIPAAFATLVAARAL